MYTDDWRILSLIPPLLFYIVLIVISSLNFRQQNVKDLVQDFWESIGSFPLTNLSLCPKPSLTLAHIDGYGHGCDCYSDGLKAGSCGTRYKYCDGILESYKKDGANLTFWQRDENNNTLGFCASVPNEKGANIYLRYLENAVKKDEACKAGYIKCGKLDNFSPERYICVEENEECPINDIIINDKSDFNSDYTRIELSNGKYLYAGYSPKKDNPTYVGLKAMEGKPCADEAYTDTLYPQFLLDKNFKKYGCSQKVANYYYNDLQYQGEALATMNKNDFYELNNINLIEKYNYLHYEFPYHSLIADINLYAKSYIPFDLECVKSENFDFEKFNEKYRDQVLKGVKKNHQCTIGIIAVSVIATAAYIAFLIFVFVKLNISYSSDYRKALYINMAGVVAFLAALAVPAFIGFNSLESRNIAKCSDDLNNAKFEYYNKRINRIYRYSLTMVVLPFLTLLHFFVVGIYYLVKKVSWDCCEKKVKYNYSNNNNSNNNSNNRMGDVKNSRVNTNNNIENLQNSEDKNINKSVEEIYYPKDIGVNFKNEENNSNDERIVKVFENHEDLKSSQSLPGKENLSNSEAMPVNANPVNPNPVNPNTDGIPNPVSANPVANSPEGIPNPVSANPVNNNIAALPAIVEGGYDSAAIMGQYYNPHNKS